jgi:hypothetical protein
MGVHVTTQGAIGNAYKHLDGRREGRRHHCRRRRGLVENSETDHQETIREDEYWIHLAQGRDRWRAVVNMVMNHRLLEMEEILQ